MHCVRVRSGRTSQNAALPDQPRLDFQHQAAALPMAGGRKALSVSVRSQGLVTANRYAAVRRNADTHPRRLTRSVWMLRVA